MIMIKYTYATGVVRIAKSDEHNLVTSFEFSDDLFADDRELFNMYRRLKRHGRPDPRALTGASMLWMNITDQNTAEMEAIRLIVQAYMDGFVRRIVRESVLA